MTEKDYNYCRGRNCGDREAEIITIYTKYRYVTDSEPDIEKIRPFLLTLPDNRFWSIGDCLGKAWSAGKKIKEERK
ncbi:MAG: hypothetical protein JSV13_02855 [Nitrospiraceae bacterium]|nr:MAG: hypothetical protein JSV13_02855 [Nitrospiraceae bacterium]